MITKLLNFITYWALMLFGALLFVAFAAAGIIIAVTASDWIGTAMNLLHNAGITADVNENIVKLVIEIPFFIMGLIGVAIMLLTQRTASTNRRIKKANKAIQNVEEVATNDYMTMKIGELREILDENKIKYPKKASKADLVEIANKKIK